MDTDTIYTLHLFAGAGGGILGDLLIGHIPVGAVEIEAYPRKVLLARQLDGSIPKFPIWDDVRTFREDNPDTRSYIERLRGIRDRLCICGGFPCQDISCAGKGAGITGERSGLWKEFAKIISEIGPRYVFVENSPMLTLRGLGTVLGDLATMGYNAKWCVLGSNQARKPIKRERIWILASYDCVGRKISRQRKVDCEQPLQKDCEWQTSSNRENNLRILRGRYSSEILSRNFRGDNELASRMDRLESIGNGQDPAVVKLAWETLI